MFIEVEAKVEQESSQPEPAERLLVHLQGLYIYSPAWTEGQRDTLHHTAQQLLLSAAPAPLLDIA